MRVSLEQSKMKSRKSLKILILSKIKARRTLVIIYLYLIS